MKKLLLIISVIILSSCGNSGVSIVNSIGSKYNLNFTKELLGDKITNYYFASLPNAAMAKEIKNSIDKELNLVGTASHGNALDNLDASDTYKWETPKVKLEMRYRPIYSTNPYSYDITFWIIDK